MGCKNGKCGLSNLQNLQQPSMQQPMMQQYGMSQMNEVPMGKNVGLGKKIKRGLFGEKEKMLQVPTVTPQVMQILQQILGQGAQGLQDPTAGFDPIAQQAQTQFNQQIVPSLAERFTSLGGHGTAALSSPAFASQLGAAGAGLQENLAGMKSEYGLRNRDSLINQLKVGLYPQFENIHRPGTGGALGEAWNTGKQASMQLLKLLPFLI